MDARIRLPADRRSRRHLSSPRRPALRANHSGSAPGVAGDRSEQHRAANETHQPRTRRYLLASGHLESRARRAGSPEARQLLRHCPREFVRGTIPSFKRNPRPPGYGPAHRARSLGTGRTPRRRHSNFANGSMSSRTDAIRAYGFGASARK